MLQATETKDGVILPVKAQPNASQDKIVGEHAGKLKVAITAAPEKGKANKAIEKLLAKKLNVRPTSVSVIAGHTSRDKKVLIGDTRLPDVQSLCL